MMNICNGKGGLNHDDIVHEGKKCPCCEALRNIEILEEENKSLQKEVEDLDNQLSTCKESCGVCPNRYECVVTK